MTREDAINQLGWLKCKTNEERKLEAIDMAIEALSVDLKSQRKRRSSRSEESL